MTFPQLEFNAPEVQEKTISRGVKVLYLEDHTLPLVDFYARFRGGYARFDRKYYAAASAMPTLLRTGGTATLSPDSVDHLMDFYALDTTFGSGGESAFAGMNTVTENVDVAARLWGQMLREPRFDSAQIQIWRGKTMESVLRRRDNPTGLAFSAFNRLMYGDGPTGWEMRSSDLTPEKLTPDMLRWVHQRIFCPENMIMGVAGDISWSRARKLLDDLLDQWPECAEKLPEPRIEKPGSPRGVYLIPRPLNQSTVVMAEPGGVRRGDDEAYFASRIANSILGGSGFTSRLMNRVRSEAGLAYSVSSLWTAPPETQGIVGAITQTRSSSTIDATRMILDVMKKMTEEPPGADEVQTAIDEIVNGFVFNFEQAGQVVSRQMFYAVEDLPDDWLDRYVKGIQRVDSTDVQRVMRDHVDPSRMTILIVGDTSRFQVPVDSLGPVQVLDVDSGNVTLSSPRGSPRSPSSASPTSPDGNRPPGVASPGRAEPGTPSPKPAGSGTPTGAPRRSDPPGAAPARSRADRGFASGRWRGG